MRLRGGWWLGPVHFLLVPLDGAAEAFFKADERLVAEGFAGGGDVGQCVLDVSGAWGAVDGGVGVSGEFGEDLIRLVQSVALAAGDVEDTPGNFFSGCSGSEKICRDGIFNVSKVAALLAVAKDGGPLAAQHEKCEFCHDTAVGRVWVLARAEDVEVAEAHCFQPIDLPVAAHV